MKILGDVFLDQQYHVDIELDKFVFNLEYPLSTMGEPAKHKINLGADTPNIYETFNKLPLAVNLANNHIMDYGEEGFSKTVEYLNEKKIGYFGAGNKENNYNNPYIIKYDEKSIAFFGYCCPTAHPVFGGEGFNGSARLDTSNIEEDIKKYKKKVDFIIINLHWGDEEIIYPKPIDVKKAHAIIDSGADLIIGHHSHVVQSIEKYKGKYIFYGVGNFIFPDFNVPSSYDGKKFLNRSIKKQWKKNKETIIVQLSQDLKVSYDTAAFTKSTVQRKKITIPRWIPSKQQHYELYKKIWTKKRMLEIFLKAPRIPSIKQIKILFSIKNKQ